MKNIVTKLTASFVMMLLLAGLATATPIYMQYEGVDGSVQTAPVDKNGACSFKNVKPGNYKTYLLVPAVQKVRGAANTSNDNHKETIEILSWSWGVSNPSTMSSGGGGTGREASVPSVSEIVVTKNMDKSTPKLAEGASKGKTKSELNKQTTYNGETYYVVKMTDVLISSYSVSGQGAGDPVPTESISLNFTKISYSYKPQSEESAVIPKASWDLAKGTK